MRSFMVNNPSATIATFPMRTLYCALLLAGVLLAPTAPFAAMDVISAPAVGADQAPQVAPPALMLAQNWQSGLDPAKFLVSEKLDGVRAYWDGQVLRFRSGRLIAAPTWFTAALPKTALDGELWMGQRSFDVLSGAVRKSVPVDAEWREVRYMVFDAPAAPGVFADRAEHIATLVKQAQVPWLQAVEQTPIAHRQALQQRLQAITSAGGEGLVLHRADALWESGRSKALRKLKLQPDEEARVVAQISGKGRLAGRMGALLLEMPNGQRFALGTGFTDAQRDTPPVVGATVTYRYRDRTPAGLPKFASFLRERGAE
jgi:DNA ligase-1